MFECACRPPVCGSEGSGFEPRSRPSRSSFVAVQKVDGRDVNWIIETKGRVFPDVEHKARGIRVWCQTMREQTDQDWRYCRVDQLVFDKGQHATFEALVAAVESARVKAPSLGLVIDGR